MIYILTGVAKSGKSTVVKHIHKRYNIPYFSTDYIMMMLHEGNPELDVDIDASDSTVSNQIQPYLHGLITTLIRNQETYVIEGVHFNTPYAKELLESYPNDIRILYLGYKNKKVFDKVQELEHYKLQIPNQWYAKLSKEKLEELVEYLIKESNRIYNECQNLQLPYFEVDNLTTQLEEIINYLIKKD